ncbi:hypothetical protein ACFQU7_22970 [Pseudoroseomonas wenyumeiae]
MQQAVALGMHAAQRLPGIAESGFLDIPQRLDQLMRGGGFVAVRLLEGRLVAQGRHGQAG